AAEIDREKGVIIEEMNMHFDTPGDFSDGVYEELVYGDHPLGWDVIGRKQTVRAATRETFLDYLGHWYKPSRMVVGVGGRVGEGLAERVQELLGDLEDAPTGSPLAALVSPNGTRVKVHTKQSDQAHICLGRSEEHTSELQSRGHLVCRLLLEKKNNLDGNYLT